MLIQNALDILSDDLKAINFISAGRFGGVVHTVEQPIKNGNEIDRKRVPVSCNVSETDCNTDQFYQDLVPNSDKASVVYWEVLQPLQDEGEFQSIQTYKRNLTGSARLVGWLNTQKLGVKSCNVSGMAIRALYDTLNQRFKITSGELQNSQVQFRVISEELKSARSIFGAYDYDFTKAFWLYPYDFFAINVQVEMVFSYGCEYTFPIGAEIDCVNYTKL